MNIPARIAPPRESVTQTVDDGGQFVGFDHAVTAPRPGVLVVRTRDEYVEPTLSHAARRLRTAGRRVVEGALRSSNISVFREAATQLGLGALACDARSYASALGQCRVAIVAPLPREGSWDDAVARELGAVSEIVLVLVTTSTPPAWVDRFIEITSELTLDEKRLWMDAVTRDSEALLRHRGLHGLESWWRQARRDGGPWKLDCGPAASGGQPLSMRALELAIVWALGRRSIPLAAIERTRADAPHVDELLHAGVVIEKGSALVLSESVDAAALESLATPELRARTARLLLDESFAGDPWACARAAQLLVAEAPLDADAAMLRAARFARDGRITSELAETWRMAIEDKCLDSEVATELRVRAAERALAAGKPLDALRWCDGVAEAGTRQPRVQLTVAQAHVQLGDLVSARVVLDRLAQDANDDELRASIAVEYGELAYLTGDQDGARREAESALQLSTVPRTRLGARSILGKLLLVRCEWDAADNHFAADAIAAQTAGETTADLRARLNRAIALASKGFLEESRQTLARVLDDAERHGEHRAAALAASNLGYVAYRQRDLMGALRYWEERLNHCDSLGGRASAALPIANLAELRLMLGLVESAEHAIRFGRRILVGRLTHARAAHFECVAAQIALARGATDVAEREIQSSMLHARASGDVQDIADAAIVTAKIALADGNLQRMDEWLRVADENARSARARADVAYLRAAQQRGFGRSALESALDAYELSRQADEHDLRVQVHLLVATTARDEGRLDLARLHVHRATDLRDRIASTLSPDVRAAFLAKPEMQSLAELAASLDESRAESNLAFATSEREPPSVPTSSSPVSDVRERLLVGTDRRMTALHAAIRKAAQSESTILIHGESGTGKELVARALHVASPRAAGPLVVVNCAALVETLLLSELFGHERGAFTGATGRRRGRFELADGGTLFLDEIGDISPRTQVALLRVLQDKTFERVGGTATLTSNVRVVCATHRDLQSMVQRGEFREDLYYRIRGITLEVPPLRARTGDIPQLAEHLLERIATEHGTAPKRLTSDALAQLQEHSWPGNVRELENVLRAATVFADGSVIDAADLVELHRKSDAVVAGAQGDSSSHSVDAPSSSGPIGDPVKSSPSMAAYEHVRSNGMSLHDLKRQIERECVTRALRDSNGNITRAAELLGMKRPRVSQLVKQYGLSHSGGALEEDE